MPPATFTCLAAAVLVILAFAPARAEGNRLLPFWAQPYPYGYVRAEAGYRRIGRDCEVPHRRRTRHGFRTVIDDRCGPVLHARD